MDTKWLNFSRPKRWLVVLAIKDAIRVGTKIGRLNCPKVKTSSAKKVAAIGVWKSPPKPAAIPMVKKMHEALGSLK